MPGPAPKARGQDLLIDNLGQMPRLHQTPNFALSATGEKDSWYYPHRAEVKAAKMRVRTAPTTGTSTVGLSKQGSAGFYGTALVPTGIAVGALVDIPIGTNNVINKDDVLLVEVIAASTAGTADLAVVTAPSPA